jgi:hypothetical protein
VWWAGRTEKEQPTAAPPGTLSIVIPPGWQAVLRTADDECVGYVVPDGADGCVVPMSLLGTQLGPAGSEEFSRDLLLAVGLAALNRRWWCRLPDLLPRGLLMVENPQDTWGWRPVVIVEASPTACRIRPEWPAPDERHGQALLPVPVGGLVRAEQPV